MLTGIEVRGWFTLRHFKAAPGRLAVVVPAPGKDPTDAIDILEMLRRLVVDGTDVSRQFPRRSLTADEPHRYQEFRLALRGDTGAFTYELLVQQHRHRENGARIDSESLEHDGVHVASYNRGVLLGDENEEYDPDCDLPHSADPAYTGFGAAARDADPRIAAFAAQLARLHVLQVQPAWRIDDSEPTAEERAAEAAAMATEARALLRKASELLRDPKATVALILPDAYLTLEELTPWWTPAVDAARTGRSGQLIVYTTREALYGPLVAEHGLAVADWRPPRDPAQSSGKQQSRSAKSPLRAR